MQPSDLLERVYPGRRSDLKRAILGQSLRFFNDVGIEATTIESIRARCETSVGAIYHHFGNKEGLVAALFFAALDDQAKLRNEYLEKADTVEAGVYALVHSYVDWVDAQPEWARFVLHGRSAVSSGPFKDELATRNNQRNKSLLEWMMAKDMAEHFAHIPRELLPSLIIGQAESYSRAWLSRRVQKSPRYYRDMLASAAWRSITGLSFNC